MLPDDKMSSESITNGREIRSDLSDKPATAAAAVDDDPSEINDLNLLASQRLLFFS
jgi:hypothetical protein